MTEPDGALPWTSGGKGKQLVRFERVIVRGRKHDVHVEIMMLLGWGALPLLAYTAGRVAIRTQQMRTPPQVPVEPARRVEEMRAERIRRQVVPRGRSARSAGPAEAGSSLRVPRR